jgi:hypothetical protein
MKPEEESIVEILKDLKKRIKILEVGKLITNLTFTDTGVLIVPTGANDPVSGTEGQLFVNSTAHKLKVYVSGAWVAVH